MRIKTYSVLWWVIAIVLAFILGYGFAALVDYLFQ